MPKKVALTAGWPQFLMRPGRLPPPSSPLAQEPVSSEGGRARLIGWCVACRQERRGRQSMRAKGSAIRWLLGPCFPWLCIHLHVVMAERPSSFHPSPFSWQGGC